MKKEYRKQIDRLETINLLQTVIILFVLVILVFFIMAYSPQDNKEECLTEENTIYLRQCFERMLVWERTWDMEKNLISGSFWNTTWHETPCTDDRYKFMDEDSKK